MLRTMLLSSLLLLPEIVRMRLELSTYMFYNQNLCSSVSRLCKATRKHLLMCLACKNASNHLIFMKKFTCLKLRMVATACWMAIV